MAHIVLDARLALTVQLNSRSIRVKQSTSASCFSVISTPSRSVFRSCAASTDSFGDSIFEKLSFTTDEALPKLSATSSKLFAKFYSTSETTQHKVEE